jgi:hypothetical protein
MRLSNNNANNWRKCYHARTDPKDAEEQWGHSTGEEVDAGYFVDSPGDLKESICNWKYPTF